MEMKHCCVSVGIIGSSKLRGGAKTGSYYISDASKKNLKDLNVTKIKSSRKYKGSVVLDSLMALALLGSVLTSWVIFNQANYNRKVAKKIAAETTEYARVYAKYMNDNYNMLLIQTQNGLPIVLTPTSIKNFWNSDLATTNLFKQMPCVTVVPNIKTGDLEAVMYYVGGQSVTANKYAMIMHQALVILGSKGGLFFNGVITGNSGWSVEQGSGFLTNSNQCGSGILSNNSLAVNIDLMDQWNQNTQPYLAIAKEQDNGTDIRKKPGHMLNYNTSKSDITLMAGNGVILDNSKNNPIKLKMGYGDGTNTATVSLYINNQINTKTLADTVGPVQTGVSGDSCDYQEIGKIIADNGNISTANILNRSTLVCSQNQMMCGAINSSATCYLPTESNHVVFANTSLGIQSNSGRFICPKETPFAIGVNTSMGGANGSNQIQGNLSGYTVTIGYSINLPGTTITQATCSNMPDFTIKAIP